MTVILFFTWNETKQKSKKVNAHTKGLKSIILVIKIIVSQIFSNVLLCSLKLYMGECPALAYPKFDL